MKNIILPPIITRRVKSQMGLKGDFQIVNISKQVTCTYGDYQTSCTIPEDYFLVTVETDQGLKNDFIRLNNFYLE